MWWLFFRPGPVAKLTLREGDGPGLEFVLTSRETTIGSEEAGTRGVRVSTHIFVTLKDVDMLLEGVQHLAKRA